MKARIEEKDRGRWRRQGQPSRRVSATARPDEASEARSASIALGQHHSNSRGLERQADAVAQERSERGEVRSSLRVCRRGRFLLLEVDRLASRFRAGRQGSRAISTAARATARGRRRRRATGSRRVCVPRTSRLLHGGQQKKQNIAEWSPPYFCTAKRLDRPSSR